MFKLCPVVMLPTNQKAIKGEYAIMQNSAPGIETYLSCGILQRTEGYNIKCEKQHLYILSNEEIQKDDWIYFDNQVVLHEGLIQGEVLPVAIQHRNANGKLVCSDARCFKKVIASTDPKLNLPRPSNAFIAKYCELNGKIDKVLVEYNKNVFTMIDPNQGHEYGFPKAYCGEPTHEECVDFIKEQGYPMDLFHNYRTLEVRHKNPKVSSDNTITIKKYKEKSYTKEEVYELIRSFSSWKTKSFNSEDIKWIESKLY